MIDLETMDNRPTAAIASIGAVWFEPSGSWIGRTFNMHVDLVDCQRHGLTIGADTVLWWPLITRRIHRPRPMRT